MSTLATITSAIRARLALWLAIAFGFTAGYYVFLVGFMAARFGNWPNYITFDNVIQSYRLIIQGTPDPRDVLSLMAQEIFVETGYLHPKYHIGVWSVDFMPGKALLILLLGMLIATYAILGRAAPDCPAASRRGGAAAGGLGAVLIGLTNATMSWVVCCAAPNWVVSLTLMGLGVSTSFAIEPYGQAMTWLGVGLAAAAVMLRARRRPAGAALPLPHATSELGHVH